MFLDILGNSIYYEIHGTGIPIVTIHGFSVDHNLMKGFIEKIIPRDNYQRIYFDLPGMGKTIIKNQIFNAEQMYNTIKCFINELIGNKRYLLIGESYGGYLMRKIIKDEPQKILGAMFVCPLIIPEIEKRNLPERKIIYNNISDGNIIESELYKCFIDSAVFSTEETLKEFEKDIFVGIKNGNDKHLSTYYEKGYSFIENVDDIVFPFDNPTLFIVGRQDHCVGYKDLNIVSGNYSRASICIIDEAGHNLQIEKTKIVEVLTLDWLDRVNRK